MNTRLDIVAKLLTHLETQQGGSDRTDRTDLSISKHRGVYTVELDDDTAGYIASEPNLTDALYIVQQDSGAGL